MNSITHSERALEVFGVPARAFNVITADNGRILNQRIGARREWLDLGGTRWLLTVSLRFDDELHNGHETFSITADLRRDGREDSGGCLHDEIAAHFPEFAHLIKWHLTSTDGPMHYSDNTVYLAGNRDCYGLLAGEFRPHIDKATGLPEWKIPFQPAYDKTHEYVKATEKPAPLMLEYEQYGRTGEGKARELDAARRTAVWPDATDAELMQDRPALRAALAARLSALLAAFKADMLAVGFVWPEKR